jgi:hypothetical protein
MIRELCGRVVLTTLAIILSTGCENNGMLEPHLRLPFLSYLPKGVANHYTKAFGKGSYENYHLLSYGQFRALLDSLPIRYVMKTQPNPQRRLYRMGNRLVTNAPPLWCFANAFQVIIQRKC